MTRHVLLSASVDMVKYVGDRLLERDSLPRSLVVFPGKRPGHFVAKYLADSLHQAFAPPRLCSADEFIGALADELGAVGRPVEAADCLPIIYRLNSASRVIGSGGPDMTLDEFMPWGFKLFGDLEELYIEGVSADALRGVEEAIAEGLPARIRRKLDSLSDLYRSFYDHLRDNGLATRSVRYRVVGDSAEDLVLPDVDLLLLCGFHSLTGAERKLFRRLVRDERTACVLQDGPGIDRLIDGLGIKADAIGDASPAPRIRFHKAMDGHGEVFKLTELVQHEKDLGERDVIVVPSADSLFPIVRTTLGLVREHNISMGYPLRRTPLSTLFDRIGTLQAKRQSANYPVRDYLRLVLHPYVKNIYLDGASYPTRMILHAVEEALAEAEMRSVVLDEVEQDESILDACVRRLAGYRERAVERQRVREQIKRVHDLVIRRFESIGSIGECAARLIDVVSTISQDSPANQHPFTPSFIKAFIEGLHALQTSGLGNESLASVDRYFKLVRHYLITLSTPFAGTPVRGLQVLGFLETRGIKFDRVFVLDVNEGVLPCVSKEDSIIPYAVRKALALPLPEDRERISRYYFGNLVAGSRQADLFYVEAEDRERSRFVERLTWDIQKRQRRLADLTTDVFFPVEFGQSAPEGIPKTEAYRTWVQQSMSFSPSGLDCYLRCPVQYYYAHVLDLQAKEEVAAEPDRREIGTIVHDVLMRFFLPKIGRPLELSAGDYRTMDRVVDTVFGERYPDANQGQVYLIKAQVRRRLRDLLRFHEQSPQLQGITILQCENLVSPRAKPAARSSVRMDLPLSNGKRVAIFGRIDRVDRRGGGIHIVDYKTGKTADIPNAHTFELAQREDWPRTLKSVQLPIYVLLYHAHHPDIAVTVINAGLMLMGGARCEEKALFGERMPPDQRAIVLDRYAQAIKTLIEEILDPDRPFAPTDDEDVCSGCPYAVMCGRQWAAKTFTR